MKKIFTLFFALFTMVICANAQITDDFESYQSFTVNPAGTWTYYDGDQDTTYSINGISFTNQNYVGSCIVFNPSEAGVSYAPHSGSQFMAFFSAINTVTNDWMISPSLSSFTGGVILSLYARELTTSYGDEIMKIYYSTTDNNPSSFTLLQTENVSSTDWVYYSYNIPANATYLAICCNSDDVFALFIDDVTIMAVPTGPTITVTPTTIDFGTVNIPASGTATATITPYNLTTGITATTADPFTVSADGTTYGSTATIASTGGTLYVKYSPTTAGTDNGTVTLTSTTATATINLTGNAVDCSGFTLPFTESFESSDCPAPCWTILYGDNDPTVNTMIHSTSAYTDGSQSFRFSSYSSKNDYTQYLITPTMPSGNRILLFDYAASNTAAESFQVGYSSTGYSINDFTWSDTLTATSTDGWQTYADAVPANAVYVCIKYCSDYLYYLYIDNFRIMEASESLNANPVTMDFIGIMGTPSDAQTATVYGTALTNNITINTTAPFEVSTDNGTTFGATASIPYSTTSSLTNGEFLVRYNPTTAGNHTGVVVLTSGNSSDTIAVSGNATDCSAGIATLPFNYDFNTGMYPPLCWGYNNAENFGRVIIDDETGDYGITVGEVDYLSCPEIHSTSALLLNIDYATYGGSEASTPSSFRIGYSSTTDNYSAFTWMQTVSVMTDGFTTYSALLPAGTKYVAVDATEIGTFLLYGFLQYPNYLFFDNFSLTEINEPQIFADATFIDFGSISVNTTIIETVAVTSALLTNDITASVTTPFEISTDNSSFGATATIPAAGSNLYVRFAPTSAGSYNGNVTLTSTGATPVQIILNGNAIDCNNTPVPYYTDFSDEGMNQCWTIVDANNDGSTFEFNVEDGYAIYVYNSDNNANDWLISPVFNLGSTAAASFDYLVADSEYPERFAVYVIAAGQTYENATQVVEPTDATNDEEWLTQHIDLSAFVNQNVQIAIKCISDADEYLFGVTNFTVTDEVAVKEYDNNISVYPNPANNVINVNATSNISNVEVYTITGQKVGDFTANSTHTAISTSNLTSGLYLMKIHTDNGVINKKFSVVR